MVPARHRQPYLPDRRYFCCAAKFWMEQTLSLSDYTAVEPCTRPFAYWVVSLDPMDSSQTGRLNSSASGPGGAYAFHVRDAVLGVGVVSSVRDACETSTIPAVPEQSLVHCASTSETASLNEWTSDGYTKLWGGCENSRINEYGTLCVTAPQPHSAPADDRLPTTPISSDSEGGERSVALTSGPTSVVRRYTHTDSAPMKGGSDPLAAMADWLPKLFRTSFYSICGVHKSAGHDSRKVNQRWIERTVFCLHCCEAVCRLCVDRQRQLEFGDAPHASHPHIGICRYMYHDVVLAKDICKEMDVSQVQSYLNNGQRVMYLVRGSGSDTGAAHVPTSWQGASSSASRCRTCWRPLQKDYAFCSIFCLVTQPDDSRKRFDLNPSFRRETLSEFCARAKREGRLRHVKPGNVQHQVMYERAFQDAPGMRDSGTTSQSTEHHSARGRRMRPPRSVATGRAIKSLAKRVANGRGSKRVQDRTSGTPGAAVWIGSSSRGCGRDAGDGHELSVSCCTKSGSTSAERNWLPQYSPGSVFGVFHWPWRSASGSDTWTGGCGANPAHAADDRRIGGDASLLAMDGCDPNLNFETRLLRLSGVRKSRRKAWPVPAVSVCNVLNA